jgi:glycosyltransferase involved in cell wall biosynthesis
MIAWSPTPQRLAIMKRSFISCRKCTQRPHILVVVDNGPKEQTEWLQQQEIDIHLINNINVGVGKARNLGAKATETEFIAFVDSDIEFFNGWLNESIDALKRYDRKLIAAPRKSSPMKLRKHHVGTLGEYHLFNRASGQCLVMKRDTWKQLGWSEKNTPGGIFCNAARKKGYVFIWRANWTAKHLCRKPSYNYRHKLVDGIWRAANE